MLCGAINIYLKVRHLAVVGCMCDYAYTLAITHVKGVEGSSIYTIRAVMLCMSKVWKIAQYIL